MPSLKTHEGYLLIDHRGSPGTSQVPGGTMLEAASFTCPHCSRVIFKNPRRVRPRGYCRKCDQNVCDLPGCNLECFPIQQMLHLALEVPDQPWLARGARGEILFDPSLIRRSY